MGGYDQIEKVQSGDAPYVPIPAKHPHPGDVTEFTEPVRQRRLQIVTDDYVVVADDLQAEHEHTFDNLLHLRGARIAETDTVKRVGQRAQLDTNPLGSGQFITNVQIYSGTAPMVVESVHRIGKGKNWETGGQDSDSTPGELRIDAHVLWPAKPEVLLADYAECWSVNKKLTYEVLGDRKPLASGTFGAWMLGKGDIDVDVSGLQTLELRTTVTRGKDTRNTIFWGDAHLVTRDGRELALKDLAFENVLQPDQPNADYEGGPIRIAGTPMRTGIPAEPKDTAAPCVVRVTLAGLDVVRFKATVGGDWVVGDEEQLRKVVSVRSAGKTARFLSVLELRESKPLIKAATASGPDTLRVELLDGRVQEFTLQNLSSGKGDVFVSLTESRDGELLRQETTATLP
jgi:hypothetical protein